MTPALLNLTAVQLDGVRARLLRLTLAPEWSQRIFRHRARRLGLLFALALPFSFFTSFFFPLWVLAIGPIVYGLPHLFASYRYVGERMAPSHLSRAIHAFTAIFVGISMWRLAIDLRLLPARFIPSIPNLPELISLLITIAVGWHLCDRKRRHPVKIAGILSLVFACSWFAPLSFIGLFLLLHNLIAFFYWIAFARAGAERNLAYLATLAFCFVNALLFAGAFDFIFYSIEPVFELPLAGLDVVHLGQMMFPELRSSITLWMHAVIAYAFGQSMHYFVWMKAIPDENHGHPVPTTFKQSLSLIRRDFGVRYVVAMSLFLAAGLLAWALIRLPMARTIYFAVSAYHGYLELAGLAFTRQTRAA